MAVYRSGRRRVEDVPTFPHVRTLQTRAVNNEPSRSFTFPKEGSYYTKAITLLCQRILALLRHCAKQASNHGKDTFGTLVY